MVNNPLTGAPKRHKMGLTEAANQYNVSLLHNLVDLVNLTHRGPTMKSEQIRTLTLSSASLEMIDEGVIFDETLDDIKEEDDSQTSNDLEIVFHDNTARVTGTQRTLVVSGNDVEGFSVFRYNKNDRGFTTEVGTKRFYRFSEAVYFADSLACMTQKEFDIATA